MRRVVEFTGTLWHLSGKRVNQAHERRRTCGASKVVQVGKLTAFKYAVAYLWEFRLQCVGVAFPSASRQQFHGPDELQWPSPRYIPDKISQACPEVRL